MGDDFNFEAGRRYHFYMSLGDSNDCVTFTIDGNAPVVNTPVDLGVGFVDSNVTMYIDSMTVNYGSDFSPSFIFTIGLEQFLHKMTMMIRYI
jgi:hypothetical protein